MNNIRFLLDYCMDKPELYNDVENRLWVQFGFKHAELAMLCTFIAGEILKEREQAYDNTGKNQGTGRRKKKDLHST